jgi:PAS domain S-box-containing protein
VNTLRPSPIAAKPTNIHSLILPLAGVLMTAIFLLDLVSPLGWEVWLLYLLPLFLTFWFSHRQYLIPLATICTALIIVGFIHSPPGIPVEVAAVNRSMGVVILWITTVLLRQHDQAAEALRRQELERQTFLDSIPAMIWCRNKDNRILRANKSAAKSIGRSVEEVEGKRTEELFPAEAAQYHADDLEVINTGKPKFGMIEPYLVASGEKRWVQADKIPYRDQSGATIGVIVCAVDITDCVRAEEALHKAHEELELRVQERTSELRRTIELLKREDAERRRAENAFRTSLSYFQTFMDNSPLVAFVKDEEGRYVYTNRLWEQIFHKTNGEIIGKTDSELWPSETAEQLRENDRAVFAAGRTVELEEIVPTADGTLHTWVVFKFVLRGPSERRLLGGVALDITERKRAEEALRGSEAFKNRVLENSPDCIKVLDMEGRLLFMNKGGQQLMEISDIASLLNSQWIDFWKGEDQQKASAAVELARAGGVGRFIGFCPTAAGKPRWWDVLITPLFDASGTPDRLLSISRDITERKGAEEALRISEEQLRLALEERERLSQDLHDNIIQTIYAIGMELEECQHLMTEDETVAIKKLRHAVAQLNLVIRDVRNYIVVEEPDRISGVRLRTELTKLARAMNGAHSLRFRISLDPLAASQLTPEETKHVLSIAREAMSNSLRHSGARTGVVSLQMEHGALRLMVEDCGVGFDPQALEARGQGLRNIAARAQKLGARCQVTSEHGRGTRILIDIPKEQVHASAGD